VRKTEIPRQSRKQECRNKETKNRKVPICRKIEKSKNRKIFEKSAGEEVHLKTQGVDSKTRKLEIN